MTINTLSFQDTIRQHRKDVQANERHEASLKNRTACKCGHPTTSHYLFNSMPQGADPGCYHTLGCVCTAYEARTTADMQIVNEQLERNMGAFYEDKPCDLCGEFCEEGECLHEDCKDEPCVDCYSGSIDAAMDAVERER